MICSEHTGNIGSGRGSKRSEWGSIAFHRVLQSASLAGSRLIRSLSQALTLCRGSGFRVQNYAITIGNAVLMLIISRSVLPIAFSIICFAQEAGAFSAYRLWVILGKAYEKQ